MSLFYIYIWTCCIIQVYLELTGHRLTTVGCIINKMGLIHSVGQTNTGLIDSISVNVNNSKPNNGA